MIKDNSLELKAPALKVPEKFKKNSVWYFLIKSMLDVPYTVTDPRTIINSSNEPIYVFLTDGYTLRISLENNGRHVTNNTAEFLQKNRTITKNS